MDEIIAIAQRELDALEAKRATLQEIILLASSMAASKPEPSQATKMAPTTLQTYDAVRDILRENGAPMRPAVLLREVLRRGVEVSGKRPASTLSARLSNASEFQSVPGLGWWFADEPVPDNEGAEEDSLQGASSAPNPKTGDPNGAALEPHDLV